MITGLFGWDLLYSSIERDIKTHQDILVCLTHLVLVSNGFKCVDGVQRKEGLPEGWNKEYEMRYVYQEHLYNFKATSLDEGIMLNLEKVVGKKVSLVQLKTKSVAKITGSLEEIIPDHKNIVDVIKKQLLEKVVGFRKSRDNSSQTMDFTYFKSFDLSKGEGEKGDLYNEHATHLKT